MKLRERFEQRERTDASLDGQLLWLTILLITAFFAFYSYKADAATYNLYFNNTEQGNNSTASPSVIVKDQDGKQEVIDNRPKPEAQAQEPAKPSPFLQTTQAAASTSEPLVNYKVFRLALGYMGGHAKFTDHHDSTQFHSSFSDNTSFSNSWGDSSFASDSSFDSGFGYQEKETSVSRQLNTQFLQATWYPVPVFGFSLLLGGITGLELEFVPAIDEKFSGGFLLGAGSLYQDDRKDTSAAYIGGFAEFNFNKTFGLQLAVRSNPWSDKLSFTAGSAGLFIRL